MSASNCKPDLPPDLQADAHKGSAGRLLCIAGSREMPGAALLTVRAAQRAGAGLVRLLNAERADLQRFAGNSPETVFWNTSEWSAGWMTKLLEHSRASDVHAVVIGPGLGSDEATQELVRTCLSLPWHCPVVLDADGLNAFIGRLELLRETTFPLLLTPHPGEAARLLGASVPNDSAGRLQSAQSLSQQTGALVCLKGAGTWVVDGERTYENHTGNSAMATAGSGDVLAGILGAYLCACARSDVTWSPWQSAQAAVYVHGRCGDLARDRFGERGTIAGDLIECLPAAQKVQCD